MFQWLLALNVPIIANKKLDGGGTFYVMRTPDSIILKENDQRRQSK